MSPMVFSFSKFYHKWKFIHSAVNMMGILLSFLIEEPFFWLSAQIFSFSFLFSSISRSLEFKPIKIGYANCITLLRLIIVLILGFLSRDLTELTLFVAFLFAICLDGVDGYLARKFNHSSSEGEIFDMEVDSFMVLLLCWIHYYVYGFSWWILIPGSLRYSFEFINIFTKNWKLIEVPKKIRASIAVIFFLSLLSPFVLSHSIANYLLIGSSCLIFLSFFTPLFIFLILKTKTE